MVPRRRFQSITPVKWLGRYTDLFFLDEAVALAAGHRPCAECRRDPFNAFREAWRQAIGSAGANAPLADEIDAELHRARIGRRQEKLTHQAPLASLPDGCFGEIDGSSYLAFGGGLLLWSPEGYRAKVQVPRHEAVTILTPEPLVRCLRHGYRPAIHESALAF
jgi:hypothetical protein